MIAKQINKELTDDQKKVLFQSGTEPAFSGKYYKLDKAGIYCCANCGNSLFISEAKFDSGCGWPSFYKPITKESVKYLDDNTLGMRRVEVRCGKCDAHLGHIFPDASQTPTGQCYCINSLALDFSNQKKARR